jgi:hypothetical protein
MLRATPVSRDTAGNITMTHNVAGGTYSAAPTLATEGFFIRGVGGQSYDALEAVLTLVGAAVVTDTVDMRIWFYVPTHNGGEWLANKIQENIVQSTDSTDVRCPTLRINAIPVGATKMYVQFFNEAAAVTDVNFTVYGISGIVADVSVSDMEVDVEFSGTIGSVKIEDATNSAYKAAVDVDGALSVRDEFSTLIGILGQNSTHSSPYDFDVAWTAPTQLTLTNMTFDPTAVQIAGVAVRDASNNISAVYLPNKYTFAWTPNPGVGGLLAVTGATFAAGDTGYIVAVVNGPPKASGAGGGGAGGANNLYVSPQDFVAVYASGTTLTLGGIPFVPSDEQWVSVSQFNSAGEETSYSPASTGFTYVPGTGVLTVAGGAFDPTDLGYRVTIYGPDKAYSVPENANNILALNPDNTHYAGSTPIDATDETDGTYYRYLDMATYNHVSLQLVLNGGTAAGTGVTVTVQGTSQDDGTAAGGCVYEEMTNDLFGVPNLNAASGAAAADLWIDDSGACGGLKWLQITIVFDTTNNSGDATIYAKRWYA